MDFSLAASISSLIRELQLAAAGGRGDVENRIRHLLSQALSLLDQTRPEKPATDSASRSVRLVADFLTLAETHCRDRWRLTDYARALHVSTAHLRATCVRVTGGPPVRLIQERMMREAKRRLIGSSVPIGAIALELGFDDAGYFSRLFRAKSGMSPLQYRLSFSQSSMIPFAAVKAE